MDFRAPLALLVLSLSAIAEEGEPPRILDLTAPLGTMVNPVRANMPGGEHEYLMRLRCAAGDAPAFERRGSLGRGVYGNIVDGYELKCAGEATAFVVMDMYHPHREMTAVPGFTLQEFPARLASGCPPQVPGTPPGEYVFKWMEVEFPARASRNAFLVESPTLDGFARIRMVVAANGEPEPGSVEVVKADSDAIRLAAEASARALRFTPARHHAECAVRQETEFRLRFRPPSRKP